MPGNNSTVISIRDLRIEDYDSIVALWQDSQITYRPKGLNSRLDIEYQIKQGSAFVLVAELNGKLVGSILVTHDSRKGWINRLAVAPELRQQGLARRLVAEAENRLSEIGINVVACLVEEGNSTSKQVFERLGYTCGNIAYYSKRKNWDV